MSLATGLSYTGYNGALTQVNGGGSGLSGSLVNGKNPLTARMARELKGIKNIGLRTIMRALVQGGASQAITGGTWVRRAAVTGINQGGAILMETATAVGASGNTAAADVTEVTAAVFDDAFAPTASQWATAADRSGNGGGGKGKL